MRDTAFAGRLYMLLWDTDIDLMTYYDPNDAKSIGFDFSRNVLPLLELHGEAGYFIDKAKYTIAGTATELARFDGFSYLIGLRWLNRWNMTTILEYYHDDAGLTANEFTDYAYFKVSWPEPFNFVDFTPAVFAIYNIADMSALVGISAGYKPFTNFEFNASASIPMGASGTEYGIRPSIPLKLTARFFF